MLNHPTWQGRSSPLLYIYHYIGIGPNKEVDDDEEHHE